MAKALKSIRRVDTVQSDQLSTQQTNRTTEYTKMAGIHTYVALKTAGGGETETLLSTEHVKDM